MVLASWPSLALATMLLARTHAHMEMSNPYPIDSQLNPAVPVSMKDYSYTSPLFADGSNFPCKGYQNQRPILRTANYTAGHKYTMTFYGTAMHGGGSCQISLSYDNGKTFRVIKSMIGGCPLQLSYDFTIPSYAPAGTALLGWSWMNLIGNREYYMNCAWVEISSTAAASSSSHSGPLSGPGFRHHSPPRRRSAAASRAGGEDEALVRRERFTSFDQLPYIWKANLPPENNCVTVEDVQVVFTDPGPDVVYGSGLSPSSPPSKDNRCDSRGPPGPAYKDLPIGPFGSFAGSGSGSGGGESSSSSSTLATSPTSKTASPTLPSIPSPTLPNIPSPTLPNIPSPTLPGLPTTLPTAHGIRHSKCNSNTPGLGLKCLRKGQGFAICDHDTWVDMGSVAYGTKCSGPPGRAVIVASNWN